MGPLEEGSVESINNGGGAPSFPSESTAPEARDAALGAPAEAEPGAREPVLCQHCGRTATNGVSCEGICVADSGY